MLFLVVLLLLKMPNNSSFDLEAVIANRCPTDECIPFHHIGTCLKCEQYFFEEDRFPAYKCDKCWTDPIHSSCNLCNEEVNADDLEHGICSLCMYKSNNE